MPNRLGKTIYTGAGSPYIFQATQAKPDEHLQPLDPEFVSGINFKQPSHEKPWYHLQSFTTHHRGTNHCHALVMSFHSCKSLACIDHVISFKHQVCPIPQDQWLRKNQIAKSNIHNQEPNLALTILQSPMIIGTPSKSNHYWHPFKIQYPMEPK
jgi:hypothetical protein